MGFLECLSCGCLTAVAGTACPSCDVVLEAGDDSSDDYGVPLEDLSDDDREAIEDDLEDRWDNPEKDEEERGVPDNPYHRD